MAIVSDPKSRNMAIATGTGAVIFVATHEDKEWQPVHNLLASLKVSEIPATSADVLNRGQNLFAIGYANGSVKLFNAEDGQLLCELGAHSRQVNALVCHPTKAVFATCGDDTFVNIWEVSGSKLASLDINLIVSSRVADYQMTGVAFGGPDFNSLVSSVYDFKTMLVWDQIV